MQDWDHFLELVDSMPHRVRTMVEADGWWTRYCFLFSFVIMIIFILLGRQI